MSVLHTISNCFDYQILNRVTISEMHCHDHSNVEAYKVGCKHLNLAANICDYGTVNLGKLIKSGILADVPSIHRMTIHRARERAEKWGDKHE